MMYHGRHMTVSLLVLVQAGTCTLSKDRWSKISLWLLRLKIRYEAPWRIGMSFVMKKYTRIPLCRKKWIKLRKIERVGNAKKHIFDTLAFPGQTSFVVETSSRAQWFSSHLVANTFALPIWAGNTSNYRETFYPWGNTILTHTRFHV